ncbi:MAG TPA: cyclic pyranopterin monophosphate synthase MoaC [Solirubrobacteraceae bacterium]|nr:cyclic pyranopterin monophosphate synthase MoaC [Solirubrobacteraceae bacterium]
MVDVGDKPATDRRAVARAVVRMSAATAAAVVAGDGPKGDVLGTARIAGIQAAKRTGELIPLCHPLGLDHVDVDAQLDAQAGTVTLTATASVTARTGRKAIDRGARRRCVRPTSPAARRPRRSRRARGP